MKPSKSPQRHTFHKEKYIERKMAADEPISEDYLKMFDMIGEQERNKWNDPKSRENNLEWDLLTTDWILEKVRGSDSYAQNLYAAMCNMEWQSKAFWPTLKEQHWGCSWRYAGGIVADMQQKGDYIDWYCSGISNGDEPDVYGQGLDLQRKKYVPEGTVTEEIERDLDRLGWIPVPYKD